MCVSTRKTTCVVHSKDKQSSTVCDRVLTAAACGRTGNLLEGPVQQKWMNNELMYSNCDAEVLLNLCHN